MRKFAATLLDRLTATLDGHLGLSVNFPSRTVREDALMRGDVVFRVYGCHAERDDDTFFGAFRSRAEAIDRIEELSSREMHGESWSKRYHDKGFVIREVIVDTAFEIPTLPKPRDKYFVECSSIPNQPGTWNSTNVNVFRRDESHGAIQLFRFERNHSMFQTFEPFRSGNRDLALVSPEYTRTAVMDLASGRIIAQESDSNSGFCPAGFYVPDWWDVHDGTTIPGSEYWNADQEWPNGDFGFVWGCVWGDDASWKVQYLDLSRVANGLILRDERFGHVELAESRYMSPALVEERPPTRGSAPPDFIAVSRYAGTIVVTFSVAMAFDLASGRSKDWQRLSD